MKHPMYLFVLASIATLVSLLAVFVIAQADYHEAAYPPDPPIIHYYSAPSRRTTQRHPATVPIILYHHIRPFTDELDPLGRDLTVTPEVFSEQLHALQASGYETITLDILASALQGEGALPQKPVILTFDDGYDTIYSYAYPLLKHYKMRAVVFVIANALEKKGYLTWRDIRDMRTSGIIDIQSHTLNHRSLPALSGADLWSEIKGSKDILEKRLGSPITFLCYPFGHVSDTVTHLVERAGYDAAFTTRFGFTHAYDDRFSLPRVRLTNHDQGERLMRTLRDFDAALQK